MDRWKGKVALVTGASTGIGWEISISLAKNGIKVIAVATRLDKLQELAHKIKQEYDIEIYPMKCNLRHEDDILKIFKWAIDTFNGIDILINNAAVIFNTPLSGKLVFYPILFFPFSFYFLVRLLTCFVVC